jgi:U3 small nucleolar ribonucleoprotein component
VHGTQDVGNPLHTEIAQLFRTLAYKLDKLTGSATGPRPAIVDVPRPTNVASLTLETTGAPDAPQSALLPPQAVYKPEEDKTRQQRKRAAYKKKKAEQPTSLLGVLEKRAHNAVKKRSAAANASAREGDVTKFGKSAAVFRKLQEQRDDGGSAQVSGSKRGASDDFRGGASAQKKRRVDEYKF